MKKIYALMLIAAMALTASARHMAPGVQHAALGAKVEVEQTDNVKTAAHDNLKSLLAKDIKSGKAHKVARKAGEEFGPLPALAQDYIVSYLYNDTYPITNPTIEIVDNGDGTVDINNLFNIFSDEDLTTYDLKGLKYDWFTDTYPTEDGSEVELTYPVITIPGGGKVEAMDLAGTKFYMYFCTTDSYYQQDIHLLVDEEVGEICFLEAYLFGIGDCGFYLTDGGKRGMSFSYLEIVPLRGETTMECLSATTGEFVSTQEYEGQEYPIGGFINYAYMPEYNMAAIRGIGLSTEYLPVVFNDDHTKAIIPAGREMFYDDPEDPEAAAVTVALAIVDGEMDFTSNDILGTVEYDEQEDVTILKFPDIWGAISADYTELAYVDEDLFAVYRNTVIYCYGDLFADTGVKAPVVDEVDAPAVYYNLQGQQVQNPGKGLYILKQGSKATKVLVK